MKNISRKNDDFQNLSAAEVERINKLTTAIKAAPGEAFNLISAAIKTETNSTVKGWLMRFREAFEPLSVEVVANV